MFLIRLFSATFLLHLLACSDQSPEFRLERNTPYTLREWPDSAYLSAMDSLAGAEWVVPKKQSIPEIQFGLGEPASAIPALPPPAQPNTPTAAAAQSSNGEDFAERFWQAMNKLQEDPNNDKLFRMVTPQDGENYESLLVRAYGPAARKLPLSLTVSQLKALNGTAEPIAGQAIKVPKL